MKNSTNFPTHPAHKNHTTNNESAAVGDHHVQHDIQKVIAANFAKALLNLVKRDQYSEQK